MVLDPKVNGAAGVEDEDAGVVAPAPEPAPVETRQGSSKTSAGRNFG